MKRIYDNIVTKHLSEDQQMIFLAGPRQVGKTTISKNSAVLTDNFCYLNWDNQDHRRILIAGPESISKYVLQDKIQNTLPILVCDELHKYPKWKILLKGLYDTYKEQFHIIVTGSARLNIFKRGGDSLMGRYFPYRIHPLSIAECLTQALPSREIQQPQAINQDLLQNLLNFGGFPEPLLKQSPQFTLRWQKLRQEQLLREDIRDLSRVQEINQIEILAELIKEQSGQLMSYSNLSQKVGVSVGTISRWLEILNSFYYCFKIKPWSKHVSRSLLRNPKYYLWDWSIVKDPGSKAENFVASHLLKAVHFWTDYGLGDYDLYFVRDKEKREVDFLVTQNSQPWFLVEVKSSQNRSLNSALAAFQAQTGAKHAFQVVFDMPDINEDCFQHTTPIIVPVQSLLAQLI
ncbi:MAG: hypothetical protein A2X78_02485 [Gammaproteobacteria bacterium GWE2_37_16]|nr:MAG: hypothetical protein A2X78_02485 [Gammaproteobacteria bacterium GWE2_37_16]